MSFNQGLSGLTAASKNLDIIGHNVANASTVGAKSSRGEFADVYAASLGGNGVGEIGFGVRLQAVAQQFSQGSVTPTNNPMDLAIQGLGFFQVKAQNGSVNYTRNGQFKVNDEGFIVNNDGSKLVGYAADANGNILPNTGALQVPTNGIPAKETSEISISYVLDSREPNATGVLNFDDPRTYNKATSVRVYDVKGQPVEVGLYYRKTGEDNWDIFARANGVAPLNGGNAIARVRFDRDGTNPKIWVDANLDGAVAADGSEFTGDSLNLAVPATTVNGSTTAAIAAINMKMTDSRQYGENFSVKDLTQNGFAPGQLTEVTVDSRGMVMSKYSNGQFKPSGQLELAFFRNPQGLQPLGGNVWGLSRAAGTAVVGAPNSGNFGTLKSSALEESNVDLTKDLVDMMITQRLYQANAQTIKTQDQVLQTLINLR